MQPIQAMVHLIRTCGFCRRLPALFALAGSLCAVLPVVAGSSSGPTAGPPRTAATPMLRSRVDTAETEGEWTWQGERVSALVPRYYRWLYSIPTKVKGASLVK